MKIIGRLKNRKEIETFLKGLICPKDEYFKRIFDGDSITFKDYDSEGILLERCTKCSEGILCGRVALKYIDCPELYTYVLKYDFDSLV